MAIFKGVVLGWNAFLDFTAEARRRGGTGTRREIGSYRGVPLAMPVLKWETSFLTDSQVDSSPLLDETQHWRSQWHTALFQGCLFEWRHINPGWRLRGFAARLTLGWRIGVLQAPLLKRC